MLEMLAKDEHSSLLQNWKITGVKSFISFGPGRSEDSAVDRPEGGACHEEGHDPGGNVPKLSPLSLTLRARNPY